MTIEEAVNGRDRRPCRAEDGTNDRRCGGGVRNR
jgi:hypothetical protein